MSFDERLRDILIKYDVNYLKRLLPDKNGKFNFGSIVEDVMYDGMLGEELDVLFNDFGVTHEKIRKRYKDILLSVIDELEDKAHI